MHIPFLCEHAFIAGGGSVVGFGSSRAATSHTQVK